MIHIKNKVWNKIINYAQASYDEYDSEIGGMLVAIKNKDNNWELKDVVILKQTISSGNCVLDKEELAKYYSKTGMKYSKECFRFVWWHSHHTMGAFWSTTDLKAIEESSDGDFGFALVINLRGEYKFRVSIWQPYPMYKDVDLTFESDQKAIPVSILKEVKALCSKPTAMTTYNYNNTRNGYNYVSPEYRQFNMFEYETSFNRVWDGIDKLNTKFVCGEIKYPKYKQKLEHMNKLLSKTDSGLSINIPVEDDLLDTLMVSSPGDFIESENGHDPYALTSGKDNWLPL